MEQIMASLGRRLDMANYAYNCRLNEISVKFPSPCKQREELEKQAKLDWEMEKEIANAEAGMLDDDLYGSELQRVRRDRDRLRSQRRKESRRFKERSFDVDA